MPTPDSSADRDPLDRLAEEFVARFRAGQRPSLNEYADRHPDLADEIRDLFPALVEMEQLKPVTGERTGDFAAVAEPSDPLRVGEFRILRRVGQGGMGVVYEAVQESLGRHVALKMLPAEAVADPKRLERFRREAQAAARLHHTNIVPVFGVGAADGRHYYAMQFIAGHPLDAVIDEVKRLKEKSAILPAAPRAVSEVAAALVTGTFARVASETPEAPVAHAPGSPGDSSSPALSGSISEGGRSYWGTVARVGAQVADALAYAHGQGILHRDIKPANLLLDLRGTVWVTDFGLAKAADADDLTQMGDIVGTLRYMAPERFDGSGDARADTYALGLTLYELLTLKPAFGAENRAKLVQEVTAAAPPSPRSINPAIPRDLETIVLKAIARDPAMRYPSAGELAEDLRRYLEDRPIRARRASSAEQAFRWCRRNKAVASLLAAVVLVSAVGATVAGAFALQAERKEKEARQSAADARTSAVDAQENARRAAARERDAQEERRKADIERTRANDEARKALAGQDFIRRGFYVARLNLAGGALRDGNRGRVIDLLRETYPAPGEEDLRGEEWHYLFRQVFNESRVAKIPAGSEKSRILFTSPTRVVFATLTKPPRLLVVDAETGTQLSSAEATGSLALTLTESSTAFTPTFNPTFTADGRRMVARRGGQFIIWDTATAKEVFRTPGFARGSPDLSPTGDRIAWLTSEAEADAPKKPAGAGNFAIVVCDTATGPRQFLWSPVNRKLEEQSIQSPTFGPDGRWIVFQLGKEWFLADTRTGRTVVLNPSPLDFVPRHSCFSPEGARLAISTSPDVVTVYDLTGETPTVVAAVPGSGPFALSAKGATLVAGRPGQGATATKAQLLIYDLTDPRLAPKTLSSGLKDDSTGLSSSGFNSFGGAVLGWVAAVRFSPDERHLLVTQKTGSQVSGFAVLDPTGRQPAQVFETIAPVPTLNFRAGGERVFGVGDGEIREWAVRPPLPSSGVAGPVFGSTGGPGPGGGNRPLVPLASPDGRWEASFEREKATGTLASHLHILDRETGTRRRVATAVFWPASAAWSPDGSRLGIVRIRKPVERGFFVPFPATVPGVVTGIAMIEETNEINSLLLIDPVTARVSREIALPTGSSTVNAITFATDGRTVTVRGAFGIAIYEVETGRELFRSLAGRVTAFRNRIASVRKTGESSVVLLVDQATGRTVEADLGKMLVTRLEFSPGGRWLLIESGIATLVCDTADPKLPVVRTLQAVSRGDEPARGNPFGGGPISRPPSTGLGISYVVVSPDDRLVGVAHDGLGKVVVSEIVSGREVVTITVAHPDITSAAFSPDGRRLLTTSRTRPARTGDPTRSDVQLWDVGTGQELVVGNFAQEQIRFGLSASANKPVPDAVVRERLRLNAAGKSPGPDPVKP